MRNKIAIILAAFAAMLCSCSKDNIGVVSEGREEDKTGIHFIQSSLTKTFPMNSKEGTIDVVLSRNSNTGEYSVVLTQEGSNENLFSFSDTVTVANGQYSVTVPLKVDLSSLVPGSTVSTSLFIKSRDAYLDEDASYITQFQDKLDIEASFELEWEPYMRMTETGEKVQQTGTYYYNLFYVGSQTDMLMERAVGTTNIFRILDWAGGVPLVFKMNADHTINVPAQSIGYYYEAVGEDVYASDIAEYMNDEAAYDSYPCYFDGNETIVLNLVYYVSDGIINYGTEYIVMASDHDDDPTVMVTYDGEGRFSFELGEYASSCRALVLPGDCTGTVKAAEVKKSIIDGSAEGLRIYTEDGSDTWELAEGSNTIFVIPFDESGNAGEMMYRRFTYDPLDLLMPKIVESTFKAGEDDPYHTVEWHLKTSNAQTIKFFMYEKDIIDYYLSIGYTAEELLDYGTEMETDAVAAANADGVNVKFTDLGEGTDYAVIVGLVSPLGDVLVEEEPFAPMAHSDNFDKTKTLDDFFGSYIASMEVTVYDGSDSPQPTKENVLVNIIKSSTGDVLIQGLSDVAGYSPILSATYVPEEHTLRIPTQLCGRYDGKYVMFAYSNPIIDSMWGAEYSAELGFGSDGRLYLRATPGMQYSVNGYKFLLINDDGSNTGDFLDNKAYRYISLAKTGNSNITTTSITNSNIYQNERKTNSLRGLCMSADLGRMPEGSRSFRFDQ